MSFTILASSTTRTEFVTVTPYMYVHLRLCPYLVRIIQLYDNTLPLQSTYLLLLLNQLMRATLDGATSCSSVLAIAIHLTYSFV